MPLKPGGEYLVCGGSFIITSNKVSCLWLNIALAFHPFDTHTPLVNHNPPVKITDLPFAVIKAIIFFHQLYP
jgi:hypothetical protein